MPLTSIQSAIARLIAVNRSPSSHLAGASALYLGPRSPRSSADLDYFHDREAQVGKAFAADRGLLEESGYAVDVVLSQPGFVRAIVGRAGKSTKVEWAHDSSWRFLPPLADPVVGFRLHPLDLSINKVLALAGRDEPRDFLDVLYVHRNYLSLGSLCWAAVGKDPGYGPQMLVEMLARKGRFRPDDFAGLDIAEPPAMGELKREWLKALADARRLVRELPPGDAGCLYWDPKGKKFVDPAGDLTHLVRHFGSDGGILPSIGEAPAIRVGGIPRVPKAEEPPSAYRSHPARPKATAGRRRAKP